MLGFYIGKHSNKIELGIFSAILVLLSMMYFLPKERSMGLADGPGMPMFLLAWVIIVYLNSIKRNNY